jgi:predicted transcriptional regulator
MANVVTGRQWTLDTPNPAVEVYDHEVKVKFIEFANYINAGDAVIVKDRIGRVVWTGVGATDFSEVRSGDIGWVDGLVLDTLTSGVCRVYIQ